MDQPTSEKGIRRRSYRTDIAGNPSGRASHRWHFQSRHSLPALERNSRRKADLISIKMPWRHVRIKIDQAIDAVLRGEEVFGELLHDLRALPRPEFQASLRSKLMSTIATSVHWIPKGFHTLTPYLHPTPEAKLIDFLKNAFGAEENFRAPRPDGTIMHAQLRIGDSIVELGEVPLDTPSPKATALGIYVENVDETYRRALDAGAQSLYEPEDKPYSNREAGIKDPAGNYWFISRALQGEYNPQDDYKWPGLSDVMIHFIPRGAPDFIDFLQNAFGAKIESKHATPDGVIRYASIRIGDSLIAVGEAHDQWQPMPGGIHYYVPDVDEAYRRALAAGATSLSAPSEQRYGDRYAGVIDPHGNYWYLATHLRDAG